MPRGGRRPGSGRKPKAAALRAIDGGESHRAEAYRGLAVVAAPVMAESPAMAVDVPAPDELTAAERLVWERQAPAAVKARTLTAGTELSFGRYCRMVVVEREMSRDPGQVGGPNHRGLLQRINTLELQFLLTPVGKPIHDAPAEPEKPVNPLDRFLARKREA